MTVSRHHLALALLLALGCIPKATTGTTNPPKATPTPAPDIKDAEGEDPDAFPVDPTDATVETPTTDTPTTDTPTVETPATDTPTTDPGTPLHQAEIKFAAQLDDLIATCSIKPNNPAGQCLDTNRTTTTARVISGDPTVAGRKTEPTGPGADLRLHERHLELISGRSTTLEPTRTPISTSPFTRTPISRDPLTPSTNTRAIGFTVSASSYVAPMLAGADLAAAGEALLQVSGIAERRVITTAEAATLKAGLATLSPASLGQIGFDASPNQPWAAGHTDLRQALGLGLAYLTDLSYGSNPSTDDDHEQAWLQASRFFVVSCDGTTLVSVASCKHDAALDHTHVGEAKVLGVGQQATASPGELWVRHDGEEASFGWTFEIPAPTGLEYGLSALHGPGTPPGLSVWHTVEGSIVCGRTGAKVSVSLTGSAFPSHRAWVEGVAVADLAQGSLAWLGQPAADNGRRVRE